MARHARCVAVHHTVHGKPYAGWLWGLTVTGGSLAAHLLFSPKILQCISRQHVLSPRLAASRRISGAPPNPPEYGRYFGKGMRIDYVLIQRCVPTFLWSTTYTDTS